MTKTNKKFDSIKAKELYEGIISVDPSALLIDDENNKQIIKDLSRTYPDKKIFKTPAMQQKMLNVLKAYSNYDKQIRYVQGMNFIVGFFLYHCDQYVAFWLFVALIEEYGLRDIFLDGLPGLSEHSAILTKIMKSKYKEEYNVLERANVTLEICMVEWVFSLFSSLIPIETQILFYEGFFVEGWNFFYKVCISIFQWIDLEHLKYNDPEDIYIALKLGKHNEGERRANIKKWTDIINKAYSINI